MILLDFKWFRLFCVKMSLNVIEMSFGDVQNYKENIGDFKNIRVYVCEQ